MKVKNDDDETSKNANGKIHFNDANHCLVNRNLITNYYIRKKN